jgi:hypothetical protein
VADAAFVSRDCVLLLLNVENDSDSVALELFSLTEGRRLRQFNFPFIKPVLLALLMTHPVSHYGDDCPASRAKMFIPDPDLEIVGILFHTEVNNGHSYIVAVSINHLFKFDTNEIIEWSRWGPTTTRWLSPSRFTHAGFRSTFGSRMVTRERVYNITDLWVASNITVFDFNPRPIRRHEDATNSTAQPHRIVMDETRWDAWLEPLSEVAITSTLPFRAFCSDGPTDYLNVFLDSNTMIGRTVGSFSIHSFECLSYLVRTTRSISFHFYQIPRRLAIRPNLAIFLSLYDQ